MLKRASLIRALAADESAEPPKGKAGLVQAVKPFIAATAVVVTGALLVVAIFFTLLDLQWVAFLTGVMFAAILAMVTQATRAERKAASRGEKLGMVEYRLERETAERERLEGLLSTANERLQYFDSSSPVMLAFVDASTRYLYHNHAFRHWLGLGAGNVDGQHMRDVLGRKVFAEVEPYVQQVTGGQVVRYQRTHKAMDGSRYTLEVQFLPKYGRDGEYEGFYVVITDGSAEGGPDAAPAGRAPEGAHSPAHVGVAHALLPADGSSGESTASEHSVATAARAWEEATRRILAAINGNEFTLFCQRIERVSNGDADIVHYEILIRLLEEESGLIPPGAFFPLAEEHGLLPQLDRWVCSHVFRWMASPAGADTLRNGSIYFVNVETATVCDPDFPDFIRHELNRTGAPAGSLCMEVSEPTVALHQGDAMHFARAMKECGCLTAISGFGRDRAALAALKLFPVDFLKLDGSIVRQISNYPASLARLVAISRVAKNIGIQLVAEMVEDDATLAILREQKIDFAQGFGISLPQKLSDLGSDQSRA